MSHAVVIMFTMIQSPCLIPDRPVGRSKKMLPGWVWGFSYLLLLLTPVTWTRVGLSTLFIVQLWFVGHDNQTDMWRDTGIVGDCFVAGL